MEWFVNNMDSIFGFLGKVIRFVLLGLLVFYTIKWGKRAYDFSSDSDKRISTWLLAAVLSGLTALATYALAVFPAGSEPNNVGAIMLACAPTVCAIVFRILKRIFPLSHDDTWTHFISSLMMTVVFTVGFLVSYGEFASIVREFDIDIIYAYAVTVFALPNLVMHLGQDYFTWI